MQFLVSDMYMMDQYDDIHDGTLVISVTWTLVVTITSTRVLANKDIAQGPK